MVLRIGLLCDGAELSWHDAELVRRLEAAGIGKVTLVVEQRRVRPRPAGWLEALRAAAFRLVVRIERLLGAMRTPEIAELFRRVPVASLAGAALIALAPQVTAHARRFDAADVEAIRARQLDVLIDLGAGALRGDILRAATHGVLAFRHAAPAGFREVLERRPYTRYSVQRLSDLPGGGEVLAQGEITTQGRYLVNLRHLRRCAIGGMLDALAGVARSDRRDAQGPVIDWDAGGQPDAPPLWTSLGYVWRLGLRVAASLARHALAQRDVWELRLANADWRRLDPRSARRLAPPRGRFWGDPFVAERDGRTAVFFEEYEFQRGRGHIAALVQAEDGGFDYAGVVLQTPYHLSFPFVFRYQGEHYMCPESNEAGEIQLWRCTDWPLGWERDRTIFAGVCACDTMLFEHDGRWWMLTNLDRDGVGDYCRELHVFHADSPLSTRWTPLPGNPVVTGASQARNAGFLQRGGRLYRLAQAQGFDRYGRSIKLFEIVALSPQGYREKLRAELAPGRDDPAAGFHHFSECGGTVVFDAVCPRWLWTPRLGGAAPRRLRGSPPTARAGLPSVGGAPR